MLKALLFDLDGTLTHSDPVHYVTWQAILQDHGIAMDEGFYNTHISGRLNDQILQDLLPHLNATERQKLSNLKEATFRERARNLQPLAGSSQVIEWMQAQDLGRAIVTNAPRENAHFMLQVLGWIDLFPIVVLAEELPRGKPDPLPYQTALQRVGVAPEEALVFEDSPSGIKSAVAAGIATVAIASGHPADYLETLNPTLVIPDFTDPRLAELLEQRYSLLLR
ncbi:MULTISPECIES: HAD-IA family hydrolase [unclassified Leptolyngbya]|uniref:HAD family hydrolase n=1 Tax=unclassified Leptolyngbya TaxID=2650499 RepID=UPI0016849317|nr:MULTISPECIES: HAD-IA family hydrolase [unclassified Leptolyngbya]MBD1914123.1 HAD-IA family hydrolase [Leptolyngbya sp. FACHB-8]MBD2158724.1 HAD-IA family hydrolase [Leptolyngbya sp. FACHB-16]